VCKKNAKVFYVGRGKRGRAWESVRRSQAWKEHVRRLPEGYEVVLLHRDLTEDESIELEREEIETNGGAAAEGGTLINWIPGELAGGISIGMEIGLDIHAGDEESRKDAAAQDDAYRSVRRFKDLTPLQRLEGVRLFDEKVGPPLAPLKKVIERCNERRTCDYPDGVDDAVQIAEEISRLSSQLANKKLKFVDFCYEVEEQIDQIELCIEDASPRYRKKIADLHRAMLGWFEFFDSGNREEAQRASLEEWKRQGGLEKLKAMLINSPHLLTPELRESLGIDADPDGEGKA
jgi:hypothetical protein